MNNKKSQDKIIEHRGIVESIENGRIRVKIISTSACSSCKVKNACMSSESKEKFIDIDKTVGTAPHVGEEVTVCASMHMGQLAVWLSFGLPLLLIIAGVMLNRMGLEELTSALIALCILIIYYFVLWLCKNRIARKFRFWIKECNQS